MKFNATQQVIVRSIALLLSLIITQVIYAQPDYDFRNPILESGTDLQIGAVYRFADVKPGVDALVTVVTATGGVTLDQIDASSTGFVEAFQPFISCPPHTSGYVEFAITFVQGGTNTPMEMVEVPVTPIDVDGAPYSNGTIYEFDVIDLNGGYVDYDMLGGELEILQSGSEVTGRNIKGINYDGIDTMAKQAMFTVVNARVTNFMLRVGADNQSDELIIRYRSDYFKKFFYNNSLLPANRLASFNGNLKENIVNLYWELKEENFIQKVIVERSSSQGNFEEIGQVYPTGVSTKYSFTDKKVISSNSFYRLKLLGTTGTISYSNIILIRYNVSVVKPPAIYPTVIHNQATIEIYSVTGNSSATVSLVDYNGKLVYRKNIPIAAGLNTIALDGFDKVTGGNYIALIHANGEMQSSKVIVRH